MEVMDSLGLTPGGSCSAHAAGGWCSNVSICTSLITAHCS